MSGHRFSRWTFRAVFLASASPLKMWKVLEPNKKTLLTVSGGQGGKIALV